MNAITFYFYYCPIRIDVLIYLPQMNDRFDVKFVLIIYTWVVPNSTLNCYLIQIFDVI